MSKRDDLIQFYRILGELRFAVGGTRTLANAHAGMRWLKRGVYFFMDPGEFRRDTGEGLRVTRVGTHAVSEGAKTTLWNRLSQHRGAVTHGGGNHRGSVFRKILGEAILARDGKQHATWGHGNTAHRKVREGEQEMERRVSAYVRQLAFLWVEISDPPSKTSHRSFIERNAIALLSNFTTTDRLDPPTDAWLGLCCPKEAVLRSGLWNSNYVSEAHDREFLRVLEGHVNVFTAGLVGKSDSGGA